LKKGGTQFVKFSPADEKKFYDLYHEKAWEKIKADLKDHPDIASRLEALLRK